MRESARVALALALAILAFRAGMVVQATWPGAIDEWMVTFLVTLAFLLSAVFFVMSLTRRSRDGAA